MQKQPYRKYIQRFFIMMAVLSSAWLVSCEKSHPDAPPVISFRADAGFTNHDTTLAVGERITVGIQAAGEGNNITFFQVAFNNGTRQILLDSGLNNPQLSYQTEIIKSAAASERWTFTVMDRNRNLDSITMTLNRAAVSNYGKIITKHDVFLGAQENSQNPSFYSLSAWQAFGLNYAFNNQAIVDMIYYYDLYEATFSSPNEADAPLIFTGNEGIAKWTVKNETRYDTTTLTPDLFDLAADDSLLLAVYEPAAGKRKVKYALPGMVLSFKSHAGKIGLIRIREVEPGSSGFTRFDIKIQE